MRHGPHSATGPTNKRGCLRSVPLTVRLLRRAEIIATGVGNITHLFSVVQSYRRALHKSISVLERPTGKLGPAEPDAPPASAGPFRRGSPRSAGVPSCG